MGNIAIIPARGSSKRIPGKNIRHFDGKPMLAYAIEVAAKSQLFDRIVVSTDSPEVAAVARRWGAEVPFLRPTELASDVAPMTEVLSHAINWFRENGGCDYICCIYPTVPFLHWKYLVDGYEMITARQMPVVLSICRYAAGIERALVQVDGLINMVAPQNEQKRSQDYASHYFDAGQFYWIDPERFIRNPTLLTGGSGGVELPQHLAHDINTELEWNTAAIQQRSIPKPLQSTLGNIHFLPSRVGQIALGCAQLGMDYGVANQRGKPSERLAIEIMKTAWISGVRFFDTAQNYGNSESIIGRFIAAYGLHGDAYIISKLDSRLDWRNREPLIRRVAESMKATGGQPLWSLLLHKQEQLNDWDDGLSDTMAELQRRHLISSCGVSVYDMAYFRKAVENKEIRVIQVPANVFDRRLIRSGLYDEAQRRGKVVFIRSIYMQGLAVMSPDAVPSRIPYARGAVSVLNVVSNQLNLTAGKVAYVYIKTLYPDAFLLVGAETPEQVAQNIDWDRAAEPSNDLVRIWDKQWPNDYPELLDASKWPVSSSDIFRRRLRAILRHFTT